MEAHEFAAAMEEAVRLDREDVDREEEVRGGEGEEGDGGGVGAEGGEAESHHGVQVSKAAHKGDHHCAQSTHHRGRLALEEIRLFNSP